jgi:hypothetical protein
MPGAIDEIRKLVRARGWIEECAGVLLVGFRPGSPSARRFQTKTEDELEKELRAVSSLDTVLGDRETRVVPIVKRARSPYEGFVFVGRTTASDVVLDDSSISKSHAAFEREGAVWFVKDNRSRNGTWVDGRRLEPGPRVQIVGGAQITFGAIATYFLDGVRMRACM